METKKSNDTKIHKSLRLDKQILDYFESESVKTGLSVNALINSTLYQLIVKPLHNEPLVPTKSLNIEIWETYKISFIKRYKTEPIRNAAVNAKIAQLGKRLGNDAVEVVKFFLNHNDSFYLKQMHSIGLCLRDAESLHAQWKTKMPITTADAKKIEKESEFVSQWERLGRMTIK